MAPDRVTYVGHATVLVEIDGIRLLTDPVLRAHVGPLRRHGASPQPSVWSNLDAVLISHLHRDHADLPSLRRIGREVPILIGAGASELLRRRGFREVSELAVGQEVEIGPVTVTGVAASHAGKRHGAKDARAIGYLLEGRRRIYFAGDTDIFAGMGQLGDLDLALLPIWGWGPNLGPRHLDPDRAAQAVRLLAPRVVVPIHWGTLYPLGLSRLRPDPLRSPPDRFVARTRAVAPQVEVRVLEPGETVLLS
jgi:L-ascorbate metabolism protein UlaG (beta-lactamase superfamily)